MFIVSRSAWRTAPGGARVDPDALRHRVDDLMDERVDESCLCMKAARLMEGANSLNRSAWRIAPGGARVAPGALRQRSNDIY